MLCSCVVVALWGQTALLFYRNSALSFCYTSWGFCTIPLYVTALALYRAYMCIYLLVIPSHKMDLCRAVQHQYLQI